MVSKGKPKIHQKSLKIQLGTFRGPSVCICDPLDCKMLPKLCPRTFKCTQNDHLGTLKGAKNSTKSNNQVYNREIYIFHVLIDFNPGNKFFYSCQSFSLQISRPLVTRGAGSRGEALGYIYIYIMCGLYDT